MLVPHGRVGVALNQALLYGTAGIAWEQNNHHVVKAAPATNESTGIETSTGYVIGGGLDYAITPNVVLGLEGLHYAFGSQNANLNLDSTGAFVENATFSNQNVDTVEARLTYRFPATTQHTPLK